jgi:carboxymethylenebutenolidase
MCHESWTGGGDPFAGSTAIKVPLETGEHMPGWSFAPDRSTLGTVLLAPDIYGPSPFYAELTRRLAGAGFTATLVDYFFREGPLVEVTREAAFARRARFDEQRALRDLHAAIEMVRGGCTRVGVIGFCLAGQFALDLAAERDDLVTVGFYPFPEGVGGEVQNPAPHPIDLVDRIRGPVLAMWGSADYIPLTVIDRFGKAMHASGADYQAQIYEGAGHGFLQGLVEDRADSDVARNAWNTALRFLGHIGASGPTS